MNYEMGRVAAMTKVDNGNNVCFSLIRQSSSVDYRRN